MFVSISKRVEFAKTTYKKCAYLLVAGAGAAGLTLAFPLAAQASAACHPTGFRRDGINMTAAVMNPTAVVTGNVDATGCNVGVYFGPGTHGSVIDANVHGANYYGVVVQKATANVTNSTVHDIGETPLNGSQHGVGIYYATIAGVTNGDCTSGSTRGSIIGNTVSVYQKGGIVASCTGTEVSIVNNTVTGQGPVNYIAQNGIQAGVGAQTTMTGNTVTGNSYTGAGGASSGGILVFGGACYGGAYTTNTRVISNTITGNDVGVYLSNLDSGCNAASTKTSNNVTANAISNSGLTNTTGNGPTQGYQAGISDQGDQDNLIGNTISGIGYNPASSSPAIFTTWIDVSAANQPRLIANRFL